MTKKTVIIADDHPFFRNGIRDVIDKTDKWQVIAEAESGKQALAYYQQYLPNIVVLDITMADMSGFKAAEAILAKFPDAICVMMTMHRSASYCHKAMKVGAKGYLVKEDVVKDMIECFETVLSGEVYISKRVSREPQNDTSNVAAPETFLSQRELDILRGIAALKVNKIIARELNISVSTVQNHRHNMCQKIGLTGRQALLQYAMDWVDSQS